MLEVMNPDGQLDRIRDMLRDPGAAQPYETYLAPQEGQQALAYSAGSAAFREKVHGIGTDADRRTPVERQALTKVKKLYEGGDAKGLQDLASLEVPDDADPETASTLEYARAAAQGYLKLLVNPPDSVKSPALSPVADGLEAAGFGAEGR